MPRTLALALALASLLVGACAPGVATPLPRDGEPTTPVVRPAETATTVVVVRAATAASAVSATATPGVAPGATPTGTSPPAPVATLLPRTAEPARAAEVGAPRAMSTTPAAPDDAISPPDAASRAGGGGQPRPAVATAQPAPSAASPTEGTSAPPTALPLSPTRDVEQAPPTTTPPSVTPPSAPPTISLPLAPTARPAAPPTRPAAPSPTPLPTAPSGTSSACVATVRVSVKFPQLGGGTQTVYITAANAAGQAVGGASGSAHVRYATTSRDLALPQTDAAGTASVTWAVGGPRGTVTVTASETAGGCTATGSTTFQGR